MDERIGEYVVLRMVGEGGMGKVYEAEERLSKRRVALKVLRPELTRTPEGRRLFLNEMQILAQVEHPNVVRSLAACEVDGQLVLALELLDGRTLRAMLVARERLPWPEAVRITVDMARGLAAAHALAPPIVHRDLKPENVMVTESGAVKVMDFGVAKVLSVEAEAHATNTRSVGTLQYMSPEQIDARTIDPRSDLYTLGLVLYECLAGAAPFRSPSPRELLTLQCTAAPPPLPDEVRATLPSGVEAVLARLLAKSPEERPASAAEVVEQLSAFLSAGQGTPPARSRVERAPGDTGRPARPSDVRTLISTPHLRAARAAHSTGGAKDAAIDDAPPRLAATPPRADTVALIEGATSRTISTALALLLIVLLSLVTGLAAYVLRLRVAAEPDARAAPVRADAGSARVR